MNIVKHNNRVWVFDDASRVGIELYTGAVRQKSQYKVLQKLSLIKAVFPSLSDTCPIFYGRRDVAKSLGHMLCVKHK